MKKSYQFVSVCVAAPGENGKKRKLPAEITTFVYGLFIHWSALQEAKFLFLAPPKCKSAFFFFPWAFLKSWQFSAYELQSHVLHPTGLTVGAPRPREYLQGLWKLPLDCKEIQPVNPKGNQPWMFIGRTDAEAETNTLATWCEEPTHW